MDSDFFFLRYLNPLQRVDPLNPLQRLDTSDPTILCVPSWVMCTAQRGAKPRDTREGPQRDNSEICCYLSRSVPAEDWCYERMCFDLFSICFSQKQNKMMQNSIVTGEVLHSWTATGQIILLKFWCVTFVACCGSICPRFAKWRLNSTSFDTDMPNKQINK